MRSAMGFLITTESHYLGLTAHPKDDFFYKLLKTHGQDNKGLAQEEAH